MAALAARQQLVLVPVIRVVTIAAAETVAAIAVAVWQQLQ